MFSGSTAGAGSGEFHVYRADRAKEYARLRYLDKKDTQVSVLCDEWAAH